MGNLFTRTVRLAPFILAALLSTGCEIYSSRNLLMPETIHFDPADISRPPHNFTIDLTGDGPPPSWIVRADTNSPDHRPVLIQESADPSVYRFPLCIYNNAIARDVAAEVQWKGLSGKIDESGGLVLRYRPGNYYIARANALENNVILFKTVKGIRSKILEVPVRVSSNEWHTLRFQARRENLQVYFDGAKVIDLHDKTFKHAGQIGLWTKADSASAFTNLRLEPPTP